MLFSRSPSFGHAAFMLAQMPFEGSSCPPSAFSKIDGGIGENRE
jgi:hypothetical protein